MVGYPLCAPPSSWWWVGPSRKGGRVVVGGWHGEGRAAVLLTPRLCVGLPLCRLPCGLIECRGVVGSVLSPCSDWVLPFTLSCPSRIVQSPFSLCVCCHSIVGLGVCLCDRVVSLWNSGDGLCGVERRVCGVCCLRTTCCDGSVCLVLCCGLWNGGG